MQFEMGVAQDCQLTTIQKRVSIVPSFAVYSQRVAINACRKINKLLGGVKH